MSPILGILASSISPSLNASSYESIATVTVGAGGSTQIDFTSIPSTYKHLQIRGIGKTTSTTAGGDNIVFAVNSDVTNTNYRSHWLTGNGASATAGQVQAAGYYGYIGSLPTSATGQTNVFGGLIIDLLDYTNTNKNKTNRTLEGYDLNGSGTVYFSSQLWINTNAISSLTFSIPAGTNFAQYSSFALYGCK